MDDRQLQTSVIKTSTTEVYDKTSGILTIIQIHADQGCIHCIDLIKNGIGNQPIPDDTVTIPEPTRNDHE